MQVTPVPVRWGKRIYILGHIYRAFATGKPRFDAWGAGGGFGYRHPLTSAQSARYLIFEIGVERAYLLKYREALYLLDVIKIGLAW